MAASLVGGGALGVVLAAVTIITRLAPLDARIAAAVAITVIASVFEVGGVMGPFPERRRQVSAERLSGPLMRAAALYGFELGLGMRTWLHHAEVYAAVAIGVAFGSTPLALLVGIWFGAMRGIVPLALSIGPRKWPLQVERMARRAKVAVWPRAIIAAAGLATALAAVDARYGL
jgi:hypothetical protein